jgi:hypothetical protein
MSSVETALSDLEKELEVLAEFKSSAYLEVNGYLEEVQFTVDSCGKHIRAYHMHAPGAAGFTHAGADSIADALKQIVDWCPHAQLLVDTIAVQATRESDELKSLVCAVWSDTFQRHVINDATCGKDPMEQRKDALLTRLSPMLRGRAGGISRWNKLRGQHMLNWSNSDLSSAPLKGADLRSLNWQGSTFDNAQMESCNLSGADVSNSSLQGANLSKSNLQDCNAQHANFNNALLTGADLLGANMNHADLTNCDLKKAKLIQSDLIAVDLSTCKIDYPFTLILFQ